MAELRIAELEDAGFLRSMLIEAACWRSDGPRPPADELLADPQLSGYVTGWGRPGDLGIVAKEADERIGAAWWRHFSADASGYGFIDEASPELSIAVRPAHRGHGVGTALLERLLACAGEQSIPRLSLSVERDNPVASLYERLGFQRVAADAHGWTMLREVESRRR